MYGTVRRGKVIWRNICKGQGKNSLYYVFPESDEKILSSAKKHIANISFNRDITVICTEDSFVNSVRSVRFVMLDDQQMEQLLVYLRSCRDAMMNLNYNNVFVLSFKEAGGNSLQKLYEEKIYEEDFLIGQWLLPDLDRLDSGECNEGKME